MNEKAFLILISAMIVLIHEDWVEVRDESWMMYLVISSEM